MMKMVLPSLHGLLAPIYFLLGCYVHGHEILLDSKGITLLVRLMV